MVAVVVVVAVAVAVVVGVVVGVAVVVAVAVAVAVVVVVRIVMPSIPLQRSKQWLETKGWHCWITEHWNQFAHIRQDAFGLLDLIAIRHDSNGVFGINACEDNGSVQGHVNKYLNGYDHPKKGRIGPNPHLPVWLSAGNRFSLFGWGLRGAAGKRKTWTLRTVDFYLNGAEVKWREVLPEALDVI